MLDLCAGLQGWSQAFRGPGWEVVSVDNNPDLEPDVILDLLDEQAVQKFKVEQVLAGGFDLVVASPPCIEFYRCLAPWYDEYGQPPDMSLVRSCMELIEWFNPTSWVLENTESGHRFIEPVLGPFRQRIGPFYFWGNFAYLTNVHVARDHKARNDVWNDNPLRSNIKAKIPLEVSEGLLKSITEQPSLDCWY